MTRELRVTLAIMVVALVVFSPAIFAAPVLQNRDYLAMVFNIVPTATPTPQPTETAAPTVTLIAVTPTRDPNQCAAEYPTVCIPPPPPDLNCPDIPYRNFTVLPPDRHHFDTDHDGIGCEHN